MVEDHGGRAAWSGGPGFVLAAIGSAVGLGNMWRFAATTSVSGGAAFVLLYLGLTLAVGLPLLLAELSLGRRMRSGPVGALRSAAGAPGLLLGGAFAASGFLIFSFYAVIAGWTVRYGVTALLSGLPSDPGAYFGEVATGWDAALYHMGFVAGTAGVVGTGIRRGIERAALLLIPFLFAVLVALAVWAAALPGAGDGFAFYLRPDWSDVLAPRTIAEAAGQTYFSMSLGMGAMLTFASYRGSGGDLPAEGTVIALSDFGVAFLAGLVIFPLVFALGFEEGVIGLEADQAEGVLFLALPAAFHGLGSLGRVLAVVFFAALAAAALTSTLSLLEVVVSTAVDELGVGRPTAAAVGGAAVAVAGLAPAHSLGVLGLLNTVAGEIMLAAGALAIAVVVGWVVPDPVAELEKGAGRRIRRLLPLWLLALRWVVTPITLLVLLLMLMEVAA